MSKYVEHSCDWSPCKGHTYRGSIVWGSILKVDKSHSCGILFHLGLGFKVGAGNGVQFLG